MSVAGRAEVLKPDLCVERVWKANSPLAIDSIVWPAERFISSVCITSQPTVLYIDKQRPTYDYTMHNLTLYIYTHENIVKWTISCIDKKH